MTKKFFIPSFLHIILGLILLQSQGFCIEMDYSVDAEINKTYNATQLEEALPKLPANIEPNESRTYSKPAPQNTANRPRPTYQNDNYTAIKLPRGTKFRVTSQNWASDGSKIGGNVNFTTVRPTTKRYLTVPAGSTLRGRVVDSHLPQYANNGGLVKIEIESIRFKGANKYAEGKITKANGKMVFFNNIKGKRNYLSSVKKNVKRSHKFFRSAMKKTSQYADDGLTVILSPFTFLGGTIGYLGGVVLSPVTALKSKGGRIALPPDTLYEIKLTKDLYIYE